MTANLSRHSVCVDTLCHGWVALYRLGTMPKLWDSTIESHRHEVRAAVLRATSTVVSERGLLGVTMTAIAKKAGIGRATLYKYFPDVESVLQAWHSEQVHTHLEELHAIAAAAGGPVERLRRVLLAHATNLFESRVHAGAADAVASLHAGDRFEEHGTALQRLVAGLVRTAQADHQVRGDLDADELALFAISAVSGSPRASSMAVALRLVDTTCAALAP